MMDNIRYWSEKGITFQTFRYDYGINDLSSKSADKYIDSLKRQIFNRDVNLDMNVSDFPHVIVIHGNALLYGPQLRNPCLTLETVLLILYSPIVTN